VSRRLPPRPEEWIDRKVKIDFWFEGEKFSAYKGDVISSALIANGQKVLARSFKYHRARSTVSMANHDANVILETLTQTNIRADVTHPSAGARYQAVNTFGGLKKDLAQILNFFSALLPVGFYYKAFYRPRFLFPLWEKLIRGMTGLGKVNSDTDSWRQGRKQLFVDVLIVGAGPSGIAAAEYLGRTGLKTIIADENDRVGGTLGYRHNTDQSAKQFKDATIKNLDNFSSVSTLPMHYAAGLYEGGTVPIVGPDGIKEVHTKALIIATGSYEQPAVFRNNDAPGIILLSAAERLMNRYSVLPCESAVILAGNPEAYERAKNLKNIGLRIVAIIDLSPVPKVHEKEIADARKAGIKVTKITSIVEASLRKGILVSITVITEHNQTEKIPCDGILMSVGWSPASSLLVQAGAKLSYLTSLEQVIPDEIPAGTYAAGQVNGIHEFKSKIDDGVAAANEAARFLGCDLPVISRPKREDRAHSHPYPVSAHPKGKEFVDFDEDIQLNDLRTSWREGFNSVELMKRYSTIGMGPSQGKISNMNGIRVLADLNKKSPGAIGTTTPRPFTHPVAIGALAGQRFRRYWRTPMHQCHQRMAANFEENGHWLRPMTYGAGSMQTLIEKEYAAVRDAVGIIDVSTLGKVELFGPDCIKLLEYAYTCKFDKLRTDMTRYIFMVDGSGVLIDDGVAARFSDDHFYITTTSSNAHTVVKQLRLFSDLLNLDIAIVDRTRQVGAFNAAGPLSREVLSKVTSQSLSEADFPYLAVRELQIANVKARVMRVGFVGELGYEIHAPANSAQTIWNALIEAGKPLGIMPFGVETQRLLRLEKGHIILGQDTDGMTTPFEVNLGWGVNLKKEQSIGKNSLIHLKRQTKRQLVGFECTNTRKLEILESNLIVEGDRILGRVTSVSYSPHRKGIIGLAMIDSTDASTEQICIKDSQGNLIDAQIVSTPFYDPENLRQLTS
jgi:sarcosine oxidase subunit alpha